MAIHIVIDGYNLIRQSRQFSELDRQDMQAGRDALVSALAAYKRIKAYAITVVFDGAQAPAGIPRRDRHKGIALHYSQPGELADAVIKRMAGREKEKMLVVTSDQDIVRFVESAGGAAISAEQFEDRLEMARYMDMKGAEESDDASGWKPTTRKIGPARRLSKRQRRMRKKISKL